MPSERKVIAFRPDDFELEMVEFLTKKTGLSMSRVAALAIRQMAEREGFKPKKETEDKK